MENSLWIASSKGKDYPKIDKTKTTGILIIGGGISGLTTAYLLCKQGFKVTLVDANKIAHGASSRNTGKITVQHNVIYSKIIDKYDINTAKKYYNTSQRSIDLIKNIIEEHKIKCDFRCVPSFLFTEDESYITTLKKEFEALNALGIPSEYLTDINIPLNIKGAIKIENSFHFNPKKYLDALANLIIQYGGEIYENTSIKEVIENEKCKALTLDGIEIHSEKTIICSHVPCYDGMTFYFSKLVPNRSYIVAGLLNCDMEDGMYINVEEPRKSLATYKRDDETYLLVCGENHKVGFDKDINHYERLMELSKNTFNMDSFEYKWSTQDYITHDSLPYIGYLNSYNKDIYVITGLCKWGICNGTSGAILVSDLIVNGDENKDKGKNNIFNADRKGPIFTKTFFKENIKMVRTLVRGKFATVDKALPSKGNSSTIKIDGQTYGAYRDYDNKLYVLDISCTHLGCELLWNNSDKTWDCPCHGSRFDFKGNVIEGPANIPLNPFKVKNKINPNIVNVE